MNSADLTVEKLEAIIASLNMPKLSEPDIFKSLQPDLYPGMKIYDAPPLRQKVYVNNILYKDGTPILPAEFLAQINHDLLVLFGYEEDIFKDKIYLLGQYGMVMKPEYRHRSI